MTMPIALAMYWPRGTVVVIVPEAITTPSGIPEAAVAREMVSPEMVRIWPAVRV